MDELRKAWAAYVEAGDAEANATDWREFPTTQQAVCDARSEVLHLVGKLLEEDPPANLREVFKRYAIDPKMRPPGGGMPLWLCLANMWREDMHAFLELEGVMKADLEEVKNNQGTHDARPEDQDEL